MEILKANKRLSFSQWAQAAKKLKVSPATFKRRLLSLRENGDIVKENGVYVFSKAHLKKKAQSDKG
jgi:DNA-binding Lrp family transcriptional regulator